MLIKTDKSNWHPFQLEEKKLTGKNPFCHYWSWLKLDCWNLWGQTGPCSAFAGSWGRGQLPHDCRAQSCHPRGRTAFLWLDFKVAVLHLAREKVVVVAGREALAGCDPMGWSAQISQVSTETGGHQHQTALGIAPKELLGLSLAVLIYVSLAHARTGRLVKAVPFSCCLAKGGKKRCCPQSAGCCHSWQECGSTLHVAGSSAGC